MLPAVSDHAELLGLLRVQRPGQPLQQEAGEADDRVERRAQLVGHGGQEGGLQAVGGFGPFLGHRQLGGPGLHLGFETLIRLPQHAIAILNLRQHAVECVNEHAQLVVAGLCRPEGVVLSGGDQVGRCRELRDGPRDDPLQPGREEERH